MQSVNEIIEAIHSLPKSDQAKIGEILEKEKLETRNGDSEKNERLKNQIERYKKARKWLDEHSEEFMNEWVCLEGDKLISHGTDGLEVHRQAKEAGIEIPFVHHIVPEYDMGAW